MKWIQMKKWMNKMKSKTTKILLKMQQEQMSKWKMNLNKKYWKMRWLRILSKTVQISTKRQPTLRNHKQKKFWNQMKERFKQKKRQIKWKMTWIEMNPIRQQKTIMRVKTNKTHNKNKWKNKLQMQITATQQSDRATWERDTMAKKKLWLNLNFYKNKKMIPPIWITRRKNLKSKKTKYQVSWILSI